MRRENGEETVAAATRRRLELLTRQLRGEADGDDPAGVEVAPVPPLLVPDPGRHARGRVSLRARHLVPLLAGLALAVGVAGWFALRSAPRAVPAPEVRTSRVATLTPGSAATGPSASPSVGGTVVVDVAGKVRRPGIARLPAGSRVVDALRQAGGARGGVDLSSLNLARVLVDGEQILVGPVPGGAGRSQAGPGPTGQSATRVSLNSADLAQLETLPGVGPVTAQKILDWRTEHGAFSSVDELLDVDGIGTKTLAEIAPHVTL